MSILLFLLFGLWDCAWIVFMVLEITPEVPEYQLKVPLIHIPQPGSFALF